MHYMRYTLCAHIMCAHRQTHTRDIHYVHTSYDACTICHWISSSKCVIYIHTHTYTHIHTQSTRHSPCATSSQHTYIHTYTHTHTYIHTYIHTTMCHATCTWHNTHIYDICMFYYRQLLHVYMYMTQHTWHTCVDTRYVLCIMWSHYVLCGLCGLLICGMNPTHTYTYQRIYDRCMFYYWQLLHMYMTYMCWYAAWITCYVLCVINVTWHTAYNRNTSSKCLQPSDSTTKPDASIRPTTYTDTYIDIYTCKNRAPCHLYRHIFRYIHTYR